MEIDTLLGRLALAMLAATAAACGGGSGQQRGGDESAEVAAVIRHVAASTDPADCTRLATRRFLEQNELATGEAAVKSCREDARDAAGNARSTTVSHVRIAGNTARARAAFAGGDLDGQAVNLRVIKDRGRWKVDHIESFASFDRERFLRAAERSLRRPPQALPAEDAACIVRRLDRLTNSALQQIIVSADRDRLATASAPCIVNLLRREFARQGIPQSVTDCVVGKLDKPPYDTIRRLFAGANADRLFARIVQACQAG